MKTVPVDPLADVEPSLRRGLSPVVRWLASRPPTRRWLAGLYWAGRAMQCFAGLRTPSRRVKGEAGQPDVTVWIIDHRARRRASPTPAVLHIHGGGYIAGVPAMNFKALRRLSSKLDCLVVSVDYRLAPRTRFPGALEDNHAALAWLHANARALDIDPARIAVMGDSAGGGHAAALAIAARDRGRYPLVYQVLIYPMLDDRTGSTRAPSSPKMGAQMWTAAANVFGWTSLMGVPAGSPAAPHGAVPARVDDLAGLPPAWIGVGSLDLFHDEDIAYAGRLKAAGVPVVLELVAGAYHGFDTLVADAPLAQAFTESWMSALRRAFHPPAAKA
jgi:acetyl esterase/lipase